MPGGRGSTIIEKQLHLVHHRKSSFANLHRPLNQSKSVKGVNTICALRHTLYTHVQN